MHGILHTFSRDQNRYNDDRSSSYGNNDRSSSYGNDNGVFGNKGGSYRSATESSESYPARGTGEYVPNSAPIDWSALNEAAVSV